MEICGGGGCINPPTVAVDQVTGTVTLNTSALTPGMFDERKEEMDEEGVKREKNGRDGRKEKGE